MCCSLALGCQDKAHSSHVFSEVVPIKIAAALLFCQTGMPNVTSGSYNSQLHTELHRSVSALNVHCRCAHRGHAVPQQRAVQAQVRASSSATRLATHYMISTTSGCH